MSVLADAVWSENAVIPPSVSDSVLGKSGGGMFGVDDAMMLNAGAKVLGSAMGGGGGTSKSDQTNKSALSFDNSGWNVSMGAGSVNSARSQTSSNDWILMGMGLLALVVVWKLVKK